MIGSMNGDWEEFRADFCHSFSLIKCINSLPIDILDFEQLEESIGAAWARFLRLLASSPDLSIPNDVSLNIFCSGLDTESALKLDFAAGGSFAHLTPAEGRAILDNFLGNSSFPTDRGEPCRKESASSHESHSTIESELPPFTSQYSSVEPSPEPRTPREEEIQHSEFSSRFEDDPSGNIQNTSNLHDAQLREELSSVSIDQLHNLLTEPSLSPTVPPSSPDPLHKQFLEEVVEVEQSDGARCFSEDIWTSIPSMILPCSIGGITIEANVNPIMEVKIMP